MSTDTPDTGGQDSPNRATVALVSEQIKSLERLTDKGFGDLQRQLDDVRGLPVLVSRLQSDHAALDERERQSDAAMDRRVTALESAETDDRNYRRIHMPTLLLTGVIALAAIVGLFTQLH